MARANLGALLGNVDAEPPKMAPRATSPQAPTRDPGVASKPKAGPTTYLRFVRKETRLREDQQNALTLHARRLNRAKTTTAPRITDNTLIRIAVDLLLARIDDARGDDETEILESLRGSDDAGQGAGS